MSAYAAHQSNKSRTDKRRSLLRLSEAQAFLTWGVIMILAALVGAIYLYQASQIASVGREVQELQYELDEVKRISADLEREIAEAQSLDRLQEEALRLGFTRSDPADVDYMIIPGVPVNSTSKVEPEIVVEPEPVESIRDALWITIQSSIGALEQGESR